jgi:hypothetical protein
MLSAPLIMTLLCRAAKAIGKPEERAAHFRLEDQTPTFSSSSGPQTGLSVLMTRSSAVQPENVVTVNASLDSTVASVSRPMAFNHDYADHERQASALAAAGMVAESVRIASSGDHLLRLGLRPPPRLGPEVPPSSGHTSSVIADSRSGMEIENVSWSLDLGQMNMDDMDLDFAQMFDPAQEITNMHTEGSGWPLSLGESSVDPTPVSELVNAFESTSRVSSPSIEVHPPTSSPAH